MRPHSPNPYSNPSLQVLPDVTILPDLCPSQWLPGSLTPISHFLYDPRQDSYDTAPALEILPINPSGTIFRWLWISFPSFSNDSFPSRLNEHLQSCQTFALSKHQNSTLGDLFQFFDHFRETINSRLDLFLYLLYFKRSTAGHTARPSKHLMNWTELKQISTRPQTTL